MQGARTVRVELFRAYAKAVGDRFGDLVGSDGSTDTDSLDRFIEIRCHPRDCESCKERRGTLSLGGWTVLEL